MTGTRLLMEAAREVGTERIVLLPARSARSAFHRMGVENEKRCWSRSRRWRGITKRSKYLAEQEVLTFAQEELPVIYRESQCTGRAQAMSKPTPTGRMIVDFMKGRMWA